MSELSKVDIYKQINVLRQNLLDLTMRNQLLNFRPRTMTVEVQEGDLEEIYDRLVLKKSKKKLLQFISRTDSLEHEDESNFEKSDEKQTELPHKEESEVSRKGHEKNPSSDNREDDRNLKPESEDQVINNTAHPTEGQISLKINDNTINGSSSTEDALNDGENSLLWDSPAPDQETLQKNKEIILSTDLTGSELQRRLFYINQRARSMMEEQGYNILYLALGFLKWQEENGNTDFREAPLILIPVELERKRVKGSFKLRWTGEDIIPNISLQSKLIEQGIEIPDFKMPRTKEGVTEYLENVKKSISLESSWEIKDKIFLGFFSFTKFVMYKDLEPSSWPEDMPLEENPLIKAIFDPADEELGQGFQENQVDEKLSSGEVYHVMDADSSQIAVIEDVKSGRDLVVEGPPGTGKSQTIVNLIAELLARGNTVLFVSEKMAALEVVKDRLDSVGLGEFCLELHSRKSNKKEVLDKLESVLRNTKPVELSIDNDLNTIEELKSNLNQYVSLLHSPYEKIKWTPYQIFGVKEKSLKYFERSQSKMPRFTIENVDLCTLSHWQRSVNKFKELAELYNLVKPVSQNPWKLTQPDPILPAEEEEIETLLVNALSIFDNLNKKSKKLSKISGVNIPQTLEEMEHLIAAVEIISSFPSLERDIILNPSWDYDKLQVYQLIKSLKEYKSHTKELKHFKKDVLDEDIKKLQIEFQEQKKKLLKFLSGDFKKIKKKINKIYLGNPPENDEKIMEDLKHLRRCQELLKDIKSQDERAKSLFGSHWKAENSQAENLKTISEWILKFRKALKEGKIDEKTLIILDSIEQKEIKQITDEMHQDYHEILNIIKQLDGYLHFKTNSLWKKELINTIISALRHEMFRLKESMNYLQNWSRYSSSRAECVDSVGPKLVKIIDEDQIESTDIIPCLEGNFADALLRDLFLKEPLISRFVGDVHQKRIEEFQELDTKIIKLNRFRIAENLYKNQPSLTSNASPRSELGVLKSEFSRKRGHMPIRKLLSICGGVIQSIKPCFMMSPLSIAQYLEPHSVKNLRFDYVIFDEASQVKPEDALGALLRAKYAVIMGDTRQLPPTTFFDILIDVDSDDYDLAVLADMESILHLTKRSFPSKMLRWHYRSRHESLIAVSNQEFYDDHLLIYPSPSQEADDLGLKLIHLPETVYDRGKTATNLLEAKEVIKTVFHHYQKYDDKKSLGVGTFNVRQQQAILEELELQLKLNPKMEKYFKHDQEEHFFVKNLETIQGDERDVILVSVGYGFDSEGRLSHNFGPINQDGGERRLNVLLTRAREKCVLFSNFRGRDLKLTSSSPFGLRALKVFLEYAENKTLEQADKFIESNDNAFEDAIYEFLTEHGYQVHTQVGCAGFRIDLAILDPEYPGRYLLGIACDGPMYQSSRVARDRDRLRQQILNGLGWRFIRLWSPDWYRSRSDVQKRLLGLLEELLAEERGEEEFIPPVIEEEVEIEEEILPTTRDIIEDKEISSSPVDEISEYKTCELDIEISGELHNQPVGDVAHAVIDVVEIEGPIHYDEVVKRIRTYWGLSRAGRRVQSIMKEAVQLALMDGKITRKGDFLYYKDAPVVVRRRTGKPPAKMDLISEEEIGAAVFMVLESQYATEPDELTREVSRIFGGKIARGPAVKRTNKVINSLISKGLVERRPDGMVDLIRN